MAVHDPLIRTACLERELRTLERAERALRLDPVPRGRRADEALEHTREVALIREAGALRDHVERRVAASDLRRRARDLEPTAVLSNRDAVVGAKHARQMCRM